MIFETLVMTLASVAITVSIYTFYLSHIRRGQDWIDTTLHDIWKIILENPSFDDPEFVGKFPNIEDSALKHKYNSFGAILWNFFESIFDRRLHKQPSLQGVFGYWVPLHQNWYKENLQYYGEAFKEFIESKYLQKK